MNITTNSGNHPHFTPEQSFLGHEYIDCGICGHKVDRDLIQVHNGYQLCDLCKEQMIEDDYLKDKEEIDSVIVEAENNMKGFFELLSFDEMNGVIAMLGHYTETELNVLLVKCSNNFSINSVLFRNMVLIAIENKK